MAKRPRDLNQLAKLVVDIASGEVEDSMSEAMRQTSPKRAGGLAGAAARASKLDEAARSDIARVAANARWKKS